ncbi:UbiA family prenyltransferase [Aurantimicrobium minutum]|uniref:Lipoyltransferase n=1 Tax=Aurantimicrobium minutum TaxID=708131 RepID=A0A173LWJ8_9MICO|nr:UbiA family prenyltransferase [Aurantimicrobium minutum]BAU99232.1 lipoyltransferase [Aurantimicrobium minutum]
MLSRLLTISRPVLWVNTIGTTVMAMWLTGQLWTWDIIWILLWVTLPFNLLIYGINDIFDQETDNINIRKGGYGGAKIDPKEVPWIFWGVILTNVPFLVFFGLNYSWQANAWIWAYTLFFYFYSSPPLRFKGRPFLDSLSNADYAFPLAFVPLALGFEPIWMAVWGLMAWSLAKHTYDAIQDIEEDSYVGIKTTAVLLGAKGSLWWVSIWWAVSSVFFAFINIPLALANAGYAAWLVWLITQNDSPENAKRVYKYSVAYPYIVGAVAGVQLVLAIFFGLYQA